MDSHRGGRPSQVRPRPSNGRSTRVKVRPVTPDPTRLARYRRIERRRGLPLVAKGLLAVAVLAMGGFIVWAGGGGVGPFVASAVEGFGGFVQTVGTAVGSTPPTEAPAVSEAPVIAVPDQPYVNADTVDVTVTIPLAVTGKADTKVRLWVTLKDAPPAVLAEAAVGATSVLVIPDVPLASGRNDLQATIVGPGGESERSAVVTWVMDDIKPAVTIISPKDGSSVSKTSTTIKGKTQARSTVRLANDVNGAVATVQAGSDGLWQATIAIGEGPNTITVTITDPAGNVNTADLTLRHGSGVLRANLTASAYQFKASSLPKNVTFTVTVTGPDGGPLAGAQALFAVTVKGLGPIVSDVMLTDARGKATFTMTIPPGAMTGSGLAVVQITTDSSLTATDRQVITIK
jgi:hypothetical protein